MTRPAKIRWTRNDIGYHSDDYRFSIVKQGIYWTLIHLDGRERRLTLQAAKQAAAALA